MSFANQEILPKVGGWIRPTLGLEPYNKKSVDDSSKAALRAIGVLDQHLLLNTYLVGERVTLADLFVTGLLTRAFENVLDKAWRSEHPSITRWYETIYNQPIYSAVAVKFKLVDVAIKYTPPKKEPKAPAPPKEAPKPKAKEVDDDEEEEDTATAAPKVKHPIDLLPTATFVLDDWKRKYSNEDTRSVALPWFWDNRKTEEYSIWKLDYKYNDELTQTFMTSNLIGKLPLLS
jgi:elongation factor 1-gamma